MSALRSFRPTLVALALIVGSGCVHGTWPWHAAWGVPVSVTGLMGEVLTGELLAVSDSGIIVLSTRRVTAASFRTLTRIQLASPRGPTRTFRMAALDGIDRDRLRYYSRFPAGLEGERLTELLALFDQRTLDTFPTRLGAASLQDAARLTAERLARPEDAAAAGYRPVGPDFPGMGQHWVNVRTVLSGRVDPSEPAILSYTSIEGKATLVNVAHAVVLEGDQGAPDVFDVPAEAWHGHAGTVEDAVLAGSGHADAERGAGLGVSMLHVWLVPNPAGQLAQNNWLLPFQRIGIDGPTLRPGETSAQAAALATASGEGYHQQAVASLLTGERRSDGEEVVRRRAAEARALVDPLRGKASVGDVELLTLQALWNEMGRELAALSPDQRTRARIAELYGVGHGVHAPPRR